MTGRTHWENCLTHFDDGVEHFIAEYFSSADRKCLLIAGAGFDPRARLVANRLAAAMGDRLYGLFVREDRGDPAVNLRTLADDNEKQLRSIVKRCEVETIRIFSPDDNAAVGGQRMTSLLRTFHWPKDLTDIVLDMSALSMGVGFPAARMLIEWCEENPALNLHLMIASNPELDDRIVGEPASQAQAVRGFAGPSSFQEMPIARIWLPQLGRGRVETLRKIRATHDSIYKVCPVVPFPARNPRRADELLSEYQPALVDEWKVDARDYIYVSERNPLDCYRTVSILKKRYDKTVKEVFFPQIILSPLGSRVIAAGAMMAAVEHDLAVHYVETLRYEFKGTASGTRPQSKEMIVHIWIHGPIYAGYPGPGTRSAA
jgi:hypothetical protein